MRPSGDRPKMAGGVVARHTVRIFWADNAGIRPCCRLE